MTSSSCCPPFQAARSSRVSNSLCHKVVIFGFASTIFYGGKSRGLWRPLTGRRWRYFAKKHGAGGGTKRPAWFRVLLDPPCAMCLDRGWRCAKFSCNSAVFAGAIWGYGSGTSKSSSPRRTGFCAIWDCAVLVRANHSTGFPPAPPRSSERARKPFYPFLDPIPPNEGGA